VKRHLVPILVVASKYSKPELTEWRLYLASWGYCTPDEVAEARGVQGVTVLGLRHFTELLRWGWWRGWTTGASRRTRRLQRAWTAGRGGAWGMARARARRGS
jgi:hypothetical protein